MHGWDYILAVIAVVLVWQTLARPEENEGLQAMGRFGSLIVAVFASGVLLLIDQAVVGHSGWLYVIGGGLVAGAISLEGWQEKHQGTTD